MKNDVGRRGLPDALRATKTTDADTVGSCAMHIVSGCMPRWRTGTWNAGFHNLKGGGCARHGHFQCNHARLPVAQIDVRV